MRKKRASKQAPDLEWVATAVDGAEAWIRSQKESGAFPEVGEPGIEEDLWRALTSAQRRDAQMIIDAVEIPTETRLRLPADPVEFAQQILGLRLGAKQREVLEAVRDHPQVVVPSCHAAGKTFLAAIIVLWWLFTRRPAYVITTAPTWRQVKRLLWKEIRALFRLLPEELRARAKCDMTQLQVMGEDGQPDPYHYAYGFATERPDDMPGEHAENMLVIYDEAPGISDEQFAVMDTYQAEREVMIGNPVNPEGRFRRAVEQPELGWHTVKISAYDTPNFTGEDLPPKLLRRLLQPSRVEQWKIEWGEDSDYFRARVLAEFPNADASRVIAPMTWVQAAIEREPEPLIHPSVQIGVDVARSGGNRTVVACRIGAEIVRIESIDGQTSTQEVVWRTAEVAQDIWGRTLLPVHVLIDETGVGAGVADLLRQRSDERIQYRGVLFGARALESDRFVNWRAEAYWQLRESLRSESECRKLAITWKGPETDRLRAQISAIRYEFRGHRVKVEGKDEMLARGMPSPDEADAVVMAVGEPPIEATEEEIMDLRDVWDLYWPFRAGAAALPMMDEPRSIMSPDD